MAFKTKDQIILFIRDNGVRFAESVRMALNSHPLNGVRVPYSENFGEQLRAFKLVTKDILEDVVGDVLARGDEEDEEMDTDEETDADIDSEMEEEEDEDHDD
ncbi:MAG: hypothetical protein VXV96_16425 [Bdellovibrionota bacterium]|nr:hypothetical protein [Bdellovibrionota bacterium]